MNNTNKEIQLELPNIDTGFYHFISKERISFPSLIDNSLTVENKFMQTAHQASLFKSVIDQR